MALGIPSAIWYERVVGATDSALLAWIGGAVLIFGTPLAWYHIAMRLMQRFDP